MNEDTSQHYKKNITERLNTIDDKDDEIRVLILDDNIVLCKYIQKILRRHLSPCKVTTIQSGYDALLLINEYKSYYHLIFVDTTLPDKESECFIEGIREIGNETPVILLALSEIQIAFEKVVSLGADGIIYKPILVDELLDEIKKVLIINFEDRGIQSKFYKIPKFE